LEAKPSPGAGLLALLAAAPLSPLSAHSDGPAFPLTPAPAAGAPPPRPELEAEVLRLAGFALETGLTEMETAALLEAALGTSPLPRGAPSPLQQQQPPLQQRAAGARAGEGAPLPPQRSLFDLAALPDSGDDEGEEGAAAAAAGGAPPAPPAPQPQPAPPPRAAPPPLPPASALAGLVGGGGGGGGVARGRQPAGAPQPTSIVRARSSSRDSAKRVSFADSA